MNAARSVNRRRLAVAAAAVFAAGGSLLAAAPAASAAPPVSAGAALPVAFSSLVPMAAKAVRAEQEPVLSRGSTGTAVREWQTIVTYVLGEDSIVVDGRFGPATAAATRQVQQLFDLDTDGVVGPLTWNATRVVHAPVDPGDVNGGHAPVDPGEVSGVDPNAPVSAVGHLEVGDRGERVRLWQHMLDGDPRSTSATVADGIFGPKTLAATRAFQQRYGLVVDGIVGPRTRATMQDVRDDV